MLVSLLGTPETNQVERMPELAFSCNQIGDYPYCHHRTFIQKLKEADVEIHSQALG